MDEILKIAPLEERIYRHRCVEAWSIVVPGSVFLSAISSTSSSPRKGAIRGVRKLLRSRQMPQAKYAGIDFPYVEGLRMDEAMNPLALLCVGMYGETLPNQDGAPVRITLPWKIWLQEREVAGQDQVPEKNAAHHLESPRFRMNMVPTQRESNVDHPRWSQARNAASRNLQTPHADVQRLQRSGCLDVQRHGPEEKLLVRNLACAPSSSASGPKPPFFLLCLSRSASWSAHHQKTISARTR